MISFRDVLSALSCVASVGGPESHTTCSGARSRERHRHTSCDDGIARLEIHFSASHESTVDKGSVPPRKMLNVPLVLVLLEAVRCRREPTIICKKKKKRVDCRPPNRDPDLFEAFRARAAGRGDYEELRQEIGRLELTGIELGNEVGSFQ